MNYILRDFDEAFWRKVKVFAAGRGESIRSLILRLLTEAMKRS